MRYAIKIHGEDGDDTLDVYINSDGALVLEMRDDTDERIVGIMKIDDAKQFTKTITEYIDDRLSDREDA